jgi:hypothetical protein
MKAALDVIAKGGLVMIPLGLCSVLALAVVIERAFRWLRLGGVSEADGVLALAGRGDWDEAARAAERSSSPVARVLAAGLRHRNPAAGMAMEAAAQDELARLRRYLPVQEEHHVDHGNDLDARPAQGACAEDHGVACGLLSCRRDDPQGSFPAGAVVSPT